MTPNLRILSVWVACCLTQACQQHKSEGNSHTQALSKVATLSQTSYVPGDTALITLSQPLRRLVVQLNGHSGAIRPTLQSDSITIKVPISTSKVGFLQVVVSGVTINQTQVSDTLDLEIRSNLRPHNLQYQVANTFAHNPTSFTQGLEFHQGSLYESTGLNGQSRLLRTELTTGVILQSTALSDQYFGEGMTIVGNRIYQLTWTSGQCFRYTMDFKVDRIFHYPTQGWGLTHMDTTLIVSDGTNRLFFYTPNFQPIRQLYVYDDQGAVWKLNELEYVNGSVLANVWETNRIVQIDIASGKVIGELNLKEIVPTNLPDPKVNVLNGIAFDPTDKALYVTGKNWPAVFKLKVKDLLITKEKRQVTL